MGWKKHDWRRSGNGWRLRFSFVCHSAALGSFRSLFVIPQPLFVIPQPLFVIPQRSGGICFSFYTAATVNQRDYMFFVYILASRSRQLYVGMTNNIRGRVADHRKFKPGTYAARYKIYLLVHYEETRYVLNAIDREKELKDWNRARKVELIERHNPAWEDFAATWFDEQLP
jgi:putative endonuclease